MIPLKPSRYEPTGHLRAAVGVEARLGAWRLRVRQPFVGPDHFGRVGQGEIVHVNAPGRPRYVNVGGRLRPIGEQPKQGNPPPQPHGLHEGAGFATTPRTPAARRLRPVSLERGSVGYERLPKDGGLTEQAGTKSQHLSDEGWLAIGQEGAFS